MKPTLEERRLDALREVANVGAGRAASALSVLLGGKRMGMDIPRALKVGAEGLADLLGGPQTPVVAAFLEMTGALNGQLMVVWTLSDASHLSSFLLRQVLKRAEHSELEASALEETANIVASACMSAVGQLSGLSLLPSTPTLKRGTASEMSLLAMKSAGATPARPENWVLEARLFSDSLSNQLLLVADEASTTALLEKLGVG